jgi:hypothetical protein
VKVLISEKELNHIINRLSFLLKFPFLDQLQSQCKKPTMSSPVSSIIPKLNAAVNPMTDHINGIIMITAGHFLSLRSKMPKVKTVVGQGRPNVGDEG